MISPGLASQPWRRGPWELSKVLLPRPHLRLAESQCKARGPRHFQMLPGKNILKGSGGWELSTWHVALGNRSPQLRPWTRHLALCWLLAEPVVFQKHPLPSGSIQATWGLEATRRVRTDPNHQSRKEMVEHGPCPAGPGPLGFFSAANFFP